MHFSMIIDNYNPTLWRGALDALTARRMACPLYPAQGPKTCHLHYNAPQMTLRDMNDLTFQFHRGLPQRVGCIPVTTGVP